MGSCFQRQGNEGTLLPTMIDNAAAMADNMKDKIGTLKKQKSKHERVLPTLLERTVTNEEERIMFEEYIADTDGEFYLALFKPLLYFELAAFEQPKSSQILCKLYGQLYIAPNTNDLIQGPLSQCFDEFFNNPAATPSSFTALKEKLDKHISLKYLLTYKRQYLPESKDVGNASVTNEELDIERKSQKVFSGTLRRSQVRGDNSVISLMSDARSAMSSYDGTGRLHEPVRTHNPMMQV